MNKISDLKFSHKDQLSQDSYESLATYLNEHRNEVTDITGVSIAKLMHTKAAKAGMYANTKAIENVTDSIEKFFDNKSPQFAEKVHQAARNIPLGTGWNLEFSEQDLVNFLKDRETTLPNVAMFTTKLPDGINLSQVQEKAGKRLCLAGVDAGGCYMDARDYASLPKSWRPDVSPILLREKKVVHPSTKVDYDTQMIASATFASLAPTQEQSQQLQTILEKELTINQQTGIQAIISIMGEINKRGKQAISQLYQDAQKQLEQFRGEREPHYSVPEI